MNIAAELLGKDPVTALGWVIIHSLWQGAVIAVFLAALLVLMRRFTSRTRYIISVTALILIPVLSTISFVKAYKHEVDARVFLDRDNFSQIQQPLSDPGLSETGSTQSLNMQKKPGKILSFFSSYFKQHFPFIVTLWFIGIVFYLVRFMGGFAYDLRIKAYKTHNIPREWEKRFNKIREKIKVKKPIKLLESSIVKAPAVIGHLKPMVLLPAGLITGLPEDQVEAVLTHELAHISRRDYLVNLFQSLIDILYFYNPAVRWVSGIIRKERENCCDDVAISVSGDAVNFARALADINTASYKKQALALGFFGKKRRLLMRIKRMIRRPRMYSDFSEGFFSACILLSAVLIVVFSASASPDWNIEDMTSLLKPEYQGLQESNLESIQDNYLDIGFSPLVLELDSRVELGGSIEAQNGKVPRFLSWIIEDKTGEVVWNLSPDLLQKSGDNYSFTETITLKRGQYKWYFTKTGISYSKILDDVRILTKSPPLGPTVTKIKTWPSKEETDKPEGKNDKSNIRSLDFIYEWNGKQWRVRALIDHGCVEEFSLDNIKFLRRDIERTWDFVSKVLSKHENYRFVYKKPRKGIGDSFMDLFKKEKEKKEIQAGENESSESTKIRYSSMDDCVRIAMKSGYPSALLVYIGPMPNDQVEEVGGRIYAIMKKMVRRDTEYGNKEDMIKLPDDFYSSFYLKVSLQGIAMENINAARQKIFGFLLEYETLRRNLEKNSRSSKQ